MEFGILGPTQLIEKGRSVPLGPAKQRGMLAVLLYHAGEPVRGDAIIEFLWGPPGKADHRSKLYSLTSRLRAVLAEVGLAKALGRVPGTSAYRLDVDPATVDLHRFRQQLADARSAAGRGNPESAADILVRALGLWRGDPLVELHGAAAEQLRRSLAETHVDARKVLAENLLACGRHHSALDQLESVVDEHLLDEALARCWVRALRAVGRHDEARRFAVAFRRRFRREMHTEPDIDFAAEPVMSLSRPVRTPRHLPPDIADFTGRRAQLDELDARKGNVVVITGMPGVGKTTLAIHWAHRQSPDFPDGQLYLDAGAYGPGRPIDPPAALDRLLRALGVPPDQLPVTLEQRRERLDELLGDRRVLLLLDNVLDLVQVRPLIPRRPNCLTIITSRTRLSGLAIGGPVRTVIAAPLTEAESTALLVRIGGRDRAETDGLVTLAGLSGGHPLALRIIGEHVAAWPRARLGELAGELRHRLLEVTDEDDYVTSLATVFDWSYRALRSDAAQLFRRIARHPGTSVSPEAAAAIAGVAVPDAEVLLTDLAKAHLVEHHTARRYCFHGLLRRYAIERANAEDDPAATARHQRKLLDWYLLSAANAIAVIAPEHPPVPDLPEPAEVQPKEFGTDIEAMRWCDAERDNLGAVSRWADHHGFHRHGWQIPGVMHEVLDRYGCPGDILKLNLQALAAARRDGHEVGQIGSLINAGTAYFALHDYDRAIASFREAQQFAASTGHLEEETICRHNLASTYVSLGDAARAIEIYEGALRVCRQLAHLPGEAAVLHWLGEAHRRLGHHRQAADRYHQALTVRERLGTQRGMGQTHGGLGALHLTCGRLQAALRHCETALAMLTHAHDQKAECDTLITLTDVQRGLGMRSEAVRSGRRAAFLSEQIADSFRLVRALTVLGDALAAADDPESADHQRAMARRILDGLSGVQVGPLGARLRGEPRAGPGHVTTRRRARRCR